MREYVKPMLYSEEFTANQFIAGCALNIVSGIDTVRIYCAQTSYVTVFTNEIGCSVIHAPFTSTSEAESYFSHLFQWGDGIAEGGNITNDTTHLGWSNAQRNAARAEINNGRGLSTGTHDLGGYTNGNRGRVHAGYALDYLNGFEEGSAIS